MTTPIKTFKNSEDFESFIINERLWMYSRICEAIEEAFRRNEDVAYVLNANIEDSVSVITINSDKQEWIDSLLLTLKYYEEEEMYEKCAYIRDLINEMKN